MSNRSLGALLKCLVRRCDTRGSLFHGSVVDARGNERYLYSCQKCGRVFSSAEAPFVKEYSHLVYRDKNDLFSFGFSYGDKNDVLGLDEFIDSITRGEIYFGRIHLRKLLGGLEGLVSNYRSGFVTQQKMYLEITKQLSEKEEIISGLLSAPENAPVLVVSDVDIENERQISNANMLPTWLITLLNHGTVSVPIEAYRLFHLLLSVNYGYEVMRYRWEWNTVVENEEKRMVFQNRTKRRTKK